jgi:hypothetical protein
MLAAAAGAAGNVPGAGEMGWYGYVRSAEGGKLTVDVAQWRTARDTGCLNPTQARTVAVGPKTELAPLGVSEGRRRPGPADLRAGRKIYALGPDPGSGGVLQARWVAVKVSAAPAVPGPPTATTPEPLENDYAGWLAAGVGALALALIGGGWWVWRRRKSTGDS